MDPACRYSSSERIWSAWAAARFLMGMLMLNPMKYVGWSLIAVKASVKPTGNKTLEGGALGFRGHRRSSPGWV